MSDATISWLSGPVIRARTSGRFHVSDAILVGERQLLGEVIRVDAEGIVAQVYEDTTGLRPGDRVTSSSAPLSIRLRPGLLGNIYDGLLRPLATMSGVTVQPGMREEAAARTRYKPLVQQGDMTKYCACWSTSQAARPGLLQDTTGRFDAHARRPGDSRRANRWLRASASWIPCFPSRAAAELHYRADSARARPSCRKASRSGAMPTSSFTLAAASAVMKWRKC
jgi:hypothetical protein